MSVETTDESPRLLKLPEVMRRTAKSRAGIYKDVGLGKFPAQIKISENAVGWLESEINTWINERIAESREAV